MIMMMTKLCLGILIASGSASPTTIRVGSSAAAMSKTIQGGVQLVPDNATTRWTIEIEAGVYNERVHIQKTIGPLTLRGLASAESVLLIHACPGGAGNGKPGCTPCPPFNKTKGPTPGMRADVTTMLVLSDDFILTNMTIANNACGYNAKGGASQSDALQAMGDRQLFSDCRILGGQDTLLTGSGSTRQYFYRSYINGSCDSIYGGSTAVFDQCTITITDHITAQKPPEAGGPTYLIVNSSLLKPSKGEFDYPAGKGKTELGRPWGDHAHVVYKNVHMDEHIAPYGWGDWSHSCSKFGSKCSNDPKCWCQNVTYAEYNSSGPGAAPSARVQWARQLTTAEAAAVTPAAVLRGWVPAVPGATPAAPPKDAE
jgi:pectinesterase